MIRVNHNMNFLEKENHINKNESYDCVICLSTFHNSNEIKQLCNNSKEHIICNDCYLDVVSKSIEEHKDIHCPYCRNKVQNLEELDLTLQTKHNLPSIGMKDNKLHGKSIYYYLNKSIMENVEYINGKKHGHHITYYTNGYEKSNFSYYNGKLHGKSYLYYDNGKIYKVMNYKKDKLDGEYKEYDIHKKLLKLENYKNGEKDGLCIGFEELTYFDVCFNVQRTYHLKKTYLYVNGVLVDKK